MNKKNIIIFLVLYVFGLFFLKDVNANFDENLEQTILKRNIIEYSELLRVDRVTNRLKKEGIVPISLDSEKDHGIAAYYTFTPLFLLRRVSPHALSIAWHVYTFTIFFIGTIFLFLLIKYLSHSEKIAYLTYLLYFISQRILIDSFNNNKDIVFMSLLIIMIYFACKFIDKKKFKDGLLFGLFAAFVCNIKILGIFFFGIFGLSYIFYLLYKKEINKRNFLLGLFVAVFGLALYVILTPAMWGSGIHIIDFYKYCLSNATNFRGQISVLFEGTYYGGNNNPIPWYYLPKLMVITLPLMTTILFIFGIFYFIKDTYKVLFKKEKISLKYLIILGTIMSFLVPFMICVLKHPNVYNGWRHFYFLYGLLFIVIGYGLIYILNNNFKKVIMPLIIISLFISLFYIFKYNVRNTAYYNILVNRKNLSGYYELDYYNTTGRDSLSKFLNRKDLIYNSNNRVNIYGNGFNKYAIEMILFNDTSFKDKIDLIYPDDLKDKILNGETVYEMSNILYSELNNYDKKKIYSYKIFKSDITRFYLIEGVKDE